MSPPVSFIQGRITVEGWAIDGILIEISILASNDHKANTIIIFFIKCFIDSAGQLDTYLYIIVDLNIFFGLICVFFLG